MNIVTLKIKLFLLDKNCIFVILFKIDFNTPKDAEF